MRKTILSFLMACFALSASADQKAPAGFAYGNEQAPTGKEWENPEKLSLNKERPHAWFFSFADVESARKVLPEHSAYWQSLDGTWSFKWVGNPGEREKDFMNPAYDVTAWDKVQVPMCWNVQGIQKDGSLRWGVPIYSNQRVIFQHKVAVGDWKGGVMRTPPQDWPTYKHRNEVGSYRRTFSIPANWKDREIYINFDGVDSFFYLYVNGKYVGFSKNSRNLAQFNITKYLNAPGKGENVVAVEVYRNSDASFLESQDMMRLPGIIRSVALTAKPKVQIQDVVAIPDFDKDFVNGSLNITTTVRNLSKKDVKNHTVEYSLYANKLYSDENTPVENVKVSAPVKAVVKGNEAEVSVKLEAGEVKKWSAEAPNCYTLVAQLKDKKGKVVETVSCIVGFRKIEIKDTPASEDEFGLAGRYYYLNGQPIKMKGVNRHETNAWTGHVMTREHMLNEVMTMKRANINHVRNSHYPCTPYWYYLCNKYGIYLEDEANIESHQYYYGEASISHVPEFRDAHVARNVEMVHANVNHPSIAIWSLGNEAGPGKNFVEAYNAIKEFDQSRPVQYERNNDIVDIGSNQYPSIAWVQGAVTGKYNIKYPYHISEYAHSMGNAVGNLIDYWDAMESTNFFIGGAIWEWIDHGIKTYEKDGTPYYAYGGDFGDKPNDGTFCMDGVMMPDLSPKPQYYEVKKVYQNIGVKMLDAKTGKIEIFNKNYFEPVKGYNIVWSLWKDGVCIAKDQPLQGPRVILAPRMKQVYTLPYNFAALEAGSEYFAKVEFLLAEDQPWAKKGYVQMDEQLFVKAAEEIPALAQKGDAVATATEADGSVVVEGNGFKAVFCNATGSLHSLIYNGTTIIADGNGPKLDAYRAPVDNDNWCMGNWVKNGLHNLQHKALSHKLSKGANGEIVLSYTVESQAPNAATLLGGTSGRYKFEEHKNQKFGPDDFKFTTNQIWTIYNDGSIELQAAIVSNKPSLDLPRLGYAMMLPSALDNYAYYGRGPINNYNDRKTSQFIELHSSPVKESYTILAKPQAMGNREEVRWCALTNKAGNGAVFVGNKPMSTSALPWSEQEITLAPHPHQLPASKGIVLHLDTKVTGLGGNSCGQGGPLNYDRTKASAQNFGFAIRPVQQSNFAAQADVKPSGVAPLMISRDRVGKVTVASPIEGAKIMVRVDDGKPQPVVKTKKGKKAQPAQPAATLYTAPIDMRNGGTITAWYEGNEELSFSSKFDKIEVVPLEVVYVSSFEPGEGDASRFVDGDASTFWHTMYSVTLAKHPHWVDFDAGEMKTMKGFTYMPRQDSPNGNVKDYEIHVSQDGKEWGEPIAKGQFANNNETKRVMFGKPVQARYIRFTALSEQRGNEYATGSEFGLIAE